jgi:hypothetical protein
MEGFPDDMEKPRGTNAWGPSMFVELPGGLYGPLRGDAGAHSDSQYLIHVFGPHPKPGWGPNAWWSCRDPFPGGFAAAEGPTSIHSA